MSKISKFYYCFCFNFINLFIKFRNSPKYCGQKTRYVLLADLCILSYNPSSRGQSTWILFSSICVLKKVRNSQVMSPNEDDSDSNDGKLRISGLFLEGARWCRDTNCLVEPEKNVIRYEMPNVSNRYMLNDFQSKTKTQTSLTVFHSNNRFVCSLALVKK